MAVQIENGQVNAKSAKMDRAIRSYSIYFSPLRQSQMQLCPLFESPQ